MACKWVWARGRWPAFSWRSCFLSWVWRWGRPEDLGGAAVFLASAAADYIHGHLLAVDGGWLGR